MHCALAAGGTMKKQAFHPFLCAAALVALPALAQVSGAQGPRIALGVGVEQSDNALKTNTRERSDTKEYLDLDLGYLRDSDYLSADAQYRAEIANYRNDTTEDASVLTGQSKLAWKLLPGRMQIDVSHDRSEQIRDSRNADIRNNRQLRDIVSAGPTFMARLSPVDQIVLDGRYSQVSYDRGDETAVAGTNQSDSERTSGGLSWQHQLRKTDLLSASYQYSEVTFDEFTEELTYHQLYGTYAVKLRNSGYTVSLGVNRSERESSGDDSDGFYAQIGWNLQSGEHRFGVTAINQLTDSGVGLGGNGLIGANFSPNDSNFDVVDVVERTSLNLDYGFSGLCERCDVGLRLGYDEQDFDEQPRDQKTTGGSLTLGYKLTPTLKLSLRGDYSEIEFLQDAGGGRTDKRENYGLTLDWMLSRSLTMRAWITDEQRKSDAALQGYEELFGGVSVSYRFR
jgi:predicted porin